MPNYPTTHGEVSRIAGQRDDTFRFSTLMGQTIYYTTTPSREIGHQEVLP